ncbi:MAG: RDD family protein [Acidimicrobiaceae bacterium]|nr:RDD family protein [Acidimicrobiaceae bacterium]MDB4818525.1 RDD family protein [Acidimicrobiales bacterium]MDC1390159.1 RDD family protein [Acidimicrobiales bacterium]HAY69267.1 hypothetical protein [Acidimicrobiaceae bacterium]
MTPNPNPPNADPAESDDEPGDPLAPIAKRIGARLLDWAFLMTVWMLLGAATSERLADDTLVFQRWAVVAWMALVVVYEVGFVAWRGQTPGKIALKIQLVALKDGCVLSLPAAITRVLPVAFAIAVLGAFFPIAMVFVYFSAAFMKNSRGILDLMSGSVVIEARR